MIELPRFTESQLATRLGKGLGATRAILEQLEREGLAEREGDLWRLTDEGERRHGRALRDLRFAS